MIRFLRTFLVTALVVTPAVGPAQNATGLQQGVRVRLARPVGKPVIGNVVRVTPDSVSVFAKTGEAAVTFELADFKKVEVSLGRSRARGALIKGGTGLALGLLSGMLFGAASYSEGAECLPNTFCFGCIVICSRVQAAMAGGMIFGAAGLVVGTGVGIATGSERWQVVQSARE